MRTVLALRLAIGLGLATLAGPAAAEQVNPWTGWSNQQSTITNPGLSHQQPLGADQWAAWGSQRPGDHRGQWNDRHDRDGRDGHGDWHWDGNRWHRGYWYGGRFYAGPSYVWVPGYWTWNGVAWIWVPGYWTR